MHQTCVLPGALAWTKCIPKKKKQLTPPLLHPCHTHKWWLERTYVLSECLFWDKVRFHGEFPGTPTKLYRFHRLPSMPEIPHHNRCKHFPLYRYCLNFINIASEKMCAKEMYSFPIALFQTLFPLDFQDAVLSASNKVTLFSTLPPLRNTRNGYIYIYIYIYI